MRTYLHTGTHTSSNVYGSNYFCVHSARLMLPAPWWYCSYSLSCSSSSSPTYQAPHAVRDVESPKRRQAGAQTVGTCMSPIRGSTLGEYLSYLYGTRPPKQGWSRSSSCYFRMASAIACPIWNPQASASAAHIVKIPSHY